MHYTTEDEDLIHELIIDAWLDEETLDDSFHQCLNQLAPFGEGFREPIFAISGARLQEFLLSWADLIYGLNSIGKGSRYLWLRLTF